jgi:hypothetical protein
MQRLVLVDAAAETAGAEENMARVGGGESRRTCHGRGCLADRATSSDLRSAPKRRTSCGSKGAGFTFAVGLTRGMGAMREQAGCKDAQGEKNSLR